MKCSSLSKLAGTGSADPAAQAATDHDRDQQHAASRARNARCTQRQHSRLRARPPDHVGARRDVETEHLVADRRVASHGGRTRSAWSDRAGRRVPCAAAARRVEREAHLRRNPSRPASGRTCTQARSSALEPSVGELVETRPQCRVSNAGRRLAEARLEGLHSHLVQIASYNQTRSPSATISAFVRLLVVPAKASGPRRITTPPETSTIRDPDSTTCAKLGPQRLQAIQEITQRRQRRHRPAVTAVARRRRGETARARHSARERQPARGTSVTTAQSSGGAARALRGSRWTAAARPCPRLPSSRPSARRGCSRS